MLLTAFIIPLVCTNCLSTYLTFTHLDLMSMQLEKEEKKKRKYNQTDSDWNRLWPINSGHSSESDALLEISFKLKEYVR